MPRLLKSFMKTLISLAIVAAALGAVYVSYIYKPETKQATGGRRGGGGDFAVPVTAAPATRADVPVYFDGVGTARPLNSVLVRPQVDGKILSLSFKEGQDVKKGQILAKIDPTQYQAQVDQALAKKALSEVQLANAKRDMARYAQLSAAAVAQKTVDTQRATVDQLTAQIKSDEAAIANLKAFVDWTNVTAPIDGRVGIRLVDEGNLVRAGDQGIVTITQIQPISVIFTLPQQQLAQVNKALAQGPLAVEAVESDSKAVIDRGTVRVVDNQVDQTTGTVRLKAELPNATMQLWPGQFTNIRLLVDTLKGVVVIPSQAVQRGPTGTFVYVVGGDDKVSVRAVTIGLQTELSTVVTKGLEADERVVTTGFGRLKDGARVQTAPRGEPPPAGGALNAGAGASPARADGGGGGDVRTACRADAEKHCANVEREGRRACMQANFAQLSDGCKSAIQAAAAGAGSGGGGRARPAQ